MPDLLVCDAGPLISMAKMGVLTPWVHALGYHPVVVDCVRTEILRGPFSYGEKDEILTFLEKGDVVPAPNIHPTTDSLSLQDQACLIYAESQPSAMLLADDRLLRRAAQQSGVQVIGFPGLLLQATQKKLLCGNEALKLVDDAIELHRYRISISLYQALQHQLRKFEN